MNQHHLATHSLSQSAILPAASPDALAHSARLVNLIRQEISLAGGWISFDRYMALALYAPGLGYYSGGARKFGLLASDGSDFVTAPEMTPLFGQTLALQLSEWFDHCPRHIMEFGAGSGKLAVQLLNELDELGTGCEHYYIVELSAELRERQQATLAEWAPRFADRVTWLDTLPDRFSGIMLGNEVLDAMPVALWHWPSTDSTEEPADSSRWLARGVGWVAHDSLDGEGHLVFVDRPVNPPNHLPADLPASPPTVPYILETQVEQQGFIHTLAQVLESGYILMMDYGFPQHEFYHPQRQQGTLMCHYRHHAHDDPFYLPGLQDITAHVNFSAIAQQALADGLSLIGYTSQARFLINCGITDRLTLLDPLRLGDYLPQASALQKLVSEAEMGELFKVIAFAKQLPTTHIDEALGFMRGDRSHRL